MKNTSEMSPLMVQDREESFSRDKTSQNSRRLYVTLGIGLVVLVAVAGVTFEGKKMMRNAKSDVVTPSNRVISPTVLHQDELDFERKSVAKGALAKVKNDHSHDSSRSLSPLYRYYHAAVQDHFYTRVSSEIGSSLKPGQVGSNGYTYEGIQCYISGTAGNKLIPLYRYYNPGVQDHFYTTNSAEIGVGLQHGQTGNYGYVYEGVAGYVSATKRDGAIPLYRYYHGAVHDHFYTTSCSEIGCGLKAGQPGKNGYVFEGIQCYVWASAD